MGLQRGIHGRITCRFEIMIHVVPDDESLLGIYV